MVSHLDERLTLDVLNGEPAVADEVTIVCLDNPETMAVVRVVPLVPRDPVLGVGPCPLPAIRSGRIRRRKHRFDLVQISGRHLPKAQPSGGGGQHVRMVSRRLNSDWRLVLPHCRAWIQPVVAHAATANARPRACTRDRWRRVVAMQAT